MIELCESVERRHGARRQDRTGGLDRSGRDRRGGDRRGHASAAFQPSLNSKFDVHIDDAAARHGVSRELVRAIIQVESGFDRLAVSAAGGRGLMQLMPATARRFGVLDRFDARQNIFGGTGYLRALLDHFQGDIPLTVAAYNAGVSCVARYHGIPPYKQTQDFVRKVTALVGAARREAKDRERGQ